MEIQRRFTRAHTHSAGCILEKSDGASCQATLENISIGGALLKMNEEPVSGLQVGDHCTVTLCKNNRGAGIKILLRDCLVRL